MDLSDVGTGEETTRDERTNAMLAHLLAIFSGFVAPGIIYLVKRRDSRFVAFHAMQAFLWHVFFFALLITGFIAFAIVMVVLAAKFPHAPTPPPDEARPPLAFFLGFFGLWLAMMLGGLANFGACIYLAIRANEGKWTRYPLAGKLAMRWA